MNKTRRDVVRVCASQGRWRLALTCLFLPIGYFIQKTNTRHPDRVS